MKRIINILVWGTLVAMPDLMIRMDTPEQQLFRGCIASYLFPAIETARIRLCRLMCFIRAV